MASLRRRATGPDWVLAAFFVIFGLFFAVFAPLLWAPPAMGDLVPVEGRLLATSVIRSGAKTTHLYLLFKVEGAPGRFWNDALKDANANWLEHAQGSRVRVLFDPHGHPRLMARDAVKSYGLWVDGVELAAADTALQADRVDTQMRILFGAGMICLGMWRFFRPRGKL
jgi:hypothetical protein